MSSPKAMDRRSMLTLATGATTMATIVQAPAFAGPRPDRRRRIILVRGVRIGAGAPKTIVSITSGDMATALERAASLNANQAVDIVELRIDHLSDPTAAAESARTAAAVRKALDLKPLIATFRSKREGGRAPIENAAYAALYEAVLAARAADLIDIEIARLEESDEVAAILPRARKAGVVVVGSSHDFGGTPPLPRMLETLRRAQALGADIPKLAVMPHDPTDVLRLLEASSTFVREEATGPIITMSMGRLGGVSRLAGTTFGSAATFGSDGAASAPGQIPVAPLRTTLDSLDGERA